MLIRSQNKKKITSLCGEVKLRTYQEPTDIKDKELWCIADSTNLIIGKYSTEKKAIKVLDMICSEYDKYSRKCIELDVTGTRIYQTVFYMPQDEEVYIYNDKLAEYDSEENEELNINPGDKVRITNIEPHKKNKNNYVCLDAYVGATGEVDKFVDDQEFYIKIDFDEYYMDAINCKNGLRFSEDEIELMK